MIIERHASLWILPHLLRLWLLIEDVVIVDSHRLAVVIESWIQYVDSAVAVHLAHLPLNHRVHTALQFMPVKPRSMFGNAAVLTLGIIFRLLQVLCICKHKRRVRGRGIEEQYGYRSMKYHNKRA